MTIYHILYNYFLPVLLAMFVIYLIGKPRFLINLTNKILLLPVFRIGWPLSATVNFLLFIPLFQNAISYYSDRSSLEDYVLHFKKEHHSHEFDKNYDAHLRKIFYKERNLFIIFCLMMLIFIFVKFSGVYAKTFAVEDEIQKLKSESPKPQVEKKND